MTLRLSPARFLVLMNVAGALLGLLVTAVVARLLGPERLGVTAVIVGINASLMSFLDVRVGDLAGKLFYAAGERDNAAYRAGVIWLAVLAAVAVNGGMALLATLFGNLAVPWFIPTPVANWWLPLAALALAMSATSGALFFLMRFSGAFHFIGTWRFVICFASAGATIGVLMRRPDLDGFFLAEAAGAAVSLGLAALVSLYLWRVKAGLPLGRADWQGAWTAAKRDWRLLWYGNLLGYVKLLQRNADVLFVAWFCGERETGFYRLARQLIDQGLAILQEAIYEVNYPRLLQALGDRAATAYRALARRLFQAAAVITAVLLVAEAIVLPFAVPLIFGPAFSPAIPSMLILTLTFLGIVGVYPWLWAVFVSKGRLRGYTLSAVIAVIAQYSAALLCFHLLGATATSAMAGAVFYYLVLLPLACLQAARLAPEIFSIPAERNA